MQCKMPLIFPHIFCEESKEEVYLNAAFSQSILRHLKNIMERNIQQNYNVFDGDSDSDYSMIGDEEESHSWQSESNMSVSEEMRHLETSRLMDTPQRLISSGRPNDSITREDMQGDKLESTALSSCPTPISRFVTLDDIISLQSQLRILSEKIQDNERVDLEKWSDMEMGAHPVPGATLSEFYLLLDEVCKSKESIKVLEEKTSDVSRVQDLQQATRDRDSYLTKMCSQSEVAALRQTIEALSVELQQEKRLSNAQISTLESLERKLDGHSEELEQFVDEVNEHWDEYDSHVIKYEQGIREFQSENRNRHDLYKVKIDSLTDRLECNMQEKQALMDEKFKALEKSVQERLDDCEKALSRQITKRDWENQALDYKLDSESSDLRSLVNGEISALEEAYGGRLDQLEDTITRLQNAPRASQVDRKYGSEPRSLTARVCSCEENIENLKNFQLEAVRYTKPAVDEQNSLGQKVENLKREENIFQMHMSQEHRKLDVLVKTAFEQLAKQKSQFEKLEERTESWKADIQNELTLFELQSSNSIVQLSKEQRHCFTLATKRAEEEVQFRQKIGRSIQQVLRLTESTKEYCGTVIEAMAAEHGEKFQEYAERLRKDVQAELEETTDQCTQVLEVCQDAVKQTKATCDKLLSLGILQHK
jgi:hypothetical protein